MVPLRTAKLTLTGGRERVCRAGLPEAGRNTKEARRVSRVGGLDRGSGSSSFSERLACEIATCCAREFVDVTLLMEYPDGDVGLLPMTELPMRG